MSLYELFSTFDKMPKKADRPMSDEEFETQKNRWRSLNLPDVRI